MTRRYVRPHRRRSYYSPTYKRARANYIRLMRRRGYSKKRAYRAFHSRRHRNAKWITFALKHHKKGALHRMLGIPVHQKIGKTRLRQAIRSANKWLNPRLGACAPPQTRSHFLLLKRRAQLALNMNKRRR